MGARGAGRVCTRDGFGVPPIEGLGNAGPLREVGLEQEFFGAGSTPQDVQVDLPSWEIRMAAGRRQLAD